MREKAQMLFQIAVIRLEDQDTKGICDTMDLSECSLGNGGGGRIDCHALG
jgi:hypothetical protein